MTPIRSSTLKASSDLINQTSVGVYPETSSMYFVYVLYSQSSKRFYTGFTRDLEKRLFAHRLKKPDSFLVYYEACLNITDAMQRERNLKSGSGKRYIKSRIKRFLEVSG